MKEIFCLEASVRKLILIFLLGILFIFPSTTSAQSNVTLYSVNVQLWPEYDQPSMLVIVDFKVAPMTSLPVDLMFRIPSDANLIAVAVQAENGDLLNASFESPKTEDDIQSFKITVEQNAIYRFEYYQPLKLNNNEREFLYTWQNAYAVKNFSVNVLEPLDVKSLSTSPNYVSKQVVNELNYYEGQVVKLSANEKFTLQLQYEKTTEALVNAPQEVQPAQPVDEDTPGRVSLSNSYPYVIGVLGVAMILGGIVYYYRTGRVMPKRIRRRKIINEEEDLKTGEYCSQCGTRTQPGDKFCRTCGARLKRLEE